MRRRTKAQQRRDSNQRYIAIAIVIALSVLGFLVAKYFLENKNDAVDNVTLCPLSGPKGHYVLLVDKTDPLTFLQNEAFSVTLQHLITKDVPNSFLLSVFVLGENFKDTAKPLLEICNPGDGQDKSELTANLKQLHRQYQEKFVTPMLKQSQALVGSQSSKSSPILEMLQLVSINSFKNQDVQGPRKLFIMSDMLHNTSEFGMYKGDFDYSRFAATDYGKRTHAELNDVDVDIKLLLNTPRLQTRPLVTFWENYFEKSGARIVSLKPM